MLYSLLDEAGSLLGGTLCLLIVCGVLVTGTGCEFTASREPRTVKVVQLVPRSLCHFAVQHAAASLCLSNLGCGEWLERDLTRTVEICKRERLDREEVAQQEELEMQERIDKFNGKRPLPEG